jgi:hypothetical protein
LAAPPTLYTPGTFLLLANVEHPTLPGAAAIDGIGNATANVTTGIGTESILSGFCRH